jgi:hypothetical protein
LPSNADSGLSAGQDRFVSSARARRNVRREHFGEDSWLALFFGQNLHPQDYDPLADVLDIDETRAALLRMRSMVKDAVGTLPAHSRFIGELRA